MTWQEACRESRYNTAMREDKHFVYIYYECGRSIMKNKKTGVYRNPSPEKIRGFNNWKPVESREKIK
jgi:hypothetical protein